MSVIEHPDEPEVDDIGAYLKKITMEAEPTDSDEGWGYHGE